MIVILLVIIIGIRVIRVVIMIIIAIIVVVIHSWILESEPSSMKSNPAPVNGA